MAEPVTTFKRGRDGFEALTLLPLPGVTTHSASIGGSGDGEATLRVETGKRLSGGISTFVSVVCMRPGGGFSFAIPGDYNKRLAVSVTRCTEKSVKALHHAALRELPALELDARAFYADKVKGKEVASA